jgi:predicted ATPase
MRHVIVLDELSQEEAAALVEALARAQATLAAQELDYLMEGTAGLDPPDWREVNP